MTFSYFGTSGNDYFRYRGNDSLLGQGNAGNDTIWGDRYNDSLYGGAGKDILLGDIGNDFLVGGSGNDILVGGSGNDMLRGFSWGYNQEIDTLIGGRGSDTFMLGDTTGGFYLGGRTSNGRDASYALIKDWNPIIDRIQLHRGSSRYQLIQNRNWLGSSMNDTGIYVGNDLIGVIQDSTNVSFSRDFVFV